MKSHNRRRSRTYLQGQRSRQSIVRVSTSEKSKEKRPTPQMSGADSRKAPKIKGPQSIDIRGGSGEDIDEFLPSEGRIEDWGKEFEFRQKAKMRERFATAMLVMWIGFVAICLTRFAFTGDDLQLAAPVILSEPLSVVLKYYFG
jgi:hypothetical protein